MANDISWGDETSTSFKVYAENLWTTYGDKYIYWYLNGSLKYSYGLTADAESDDIQFNGLDPETEYEVYYMITYDERTYDEYSDTIYPTTAPEEENTEWTVSEKDSWGTIYSSTDESYDFNEYDVVRIKVIFSQSGTATFYSNGASDSRGYLSNSTDFDSEDGRPTSRLEYDSSSSGDFEFTYDVSAGTIYYLFVRHYYEDSSGSFDVYIDPPTIDYYEPDYSDTELVAIVDGTNVTLSITGLDTNYNDIWKVTWQVWNVDTNEDIVDFILRSDSMDLTWSYDKITLSESDGLESNAQYRAYVQILPYPDAIDNPFSVHTELTTFTTGEVISFDSATIVASSSYDGTSITAYIGGLDTNYSRTDRYVYWYLNNTTNYKGKTYINAYVSQTSTFSSFGTLTPGATYQIYAEVYYTSNNTLLSKMLRPIIVTTKNPRPYDFYWDVEKVQDEEIVITADEWTNLQENINLVRKYKGYSNYSFTTVSPGDDITASVYNECISAINTIYPTSITSYKVSVGDPITAEAINKLQFFINNVE